MKILIYGAGVIGSIFAGKLALAKNDVTILARGRRFDEIRSKGIVLINPKVRAEERVNVKMIKSLSCTAVFDFIIVVMQRTQVDEILPILSQNHSKNIVFAVNTASGYDRWAQAVGEDRLMLGFPSAGGERKAGKVYYFVGRGIQRIFQTTTFGEYGGAKTERLQSLVRLFNQAGIPSVFCNNMDAWQKTHVALVTNIANALYGFNCDNYKLGSSYRAVKEMVLGIKEGRRVLRHCGINPAPAKLFWMEFPASILTIFFSVFMKTKLAETTMAKHCAAAKPEMIFLQQEFDELIAKSNAVTPIIDQLKKNLYQ